MTRYDDTTRYEALLRLSQNHIWPTNIRQLTHA